MDIINTKTASIPYSFGSNNRVKIGTEIKAKDLVKILLSNNSFHMK